MKSFLRGLSANGEFSKALEYATKALPLSSWLVLIAYWNHSMIEKLKSGKDIN